MLAQIINLTYPNVFEKYRFKYSLTWDHFHHGLFGFEIRKIHDNYFNELRQNLEKIYRFTYFIESTGDNSRIMLLGNTKIFIIFNQCLKTIDLVLLSDF